MRWEKDKIIISDDEELLDVEAIFQLLSTSTLYWAQTRSIETIKKSMVKSICFEVFDQFKQVGFARVVSDQATFSWILDVIISEEYRGNQLGKWLINCIIKHPNLNKTKFALATKDAHEFYQQFGFIESQCMTLNKRSE